MMDERYDEVDDIVRVRRLPSLQIRRERRTARRSPSTRLTSIAGTASSVGFAGNQRRTRSVLGIGWHSMCAMADLKLRTTARWRSPSGPSERGIDTTLGARLRAAGANCSCPESPLLGRDLPRRRVSARCVGDRFPTRLTRGSTMPVLDRKGAHPARRRGWSSLRRAGTCWGCRSCARRKSTLIDGAGADAHDLSAPPQLFHRRPCRRTRLTAPTEAAAASFLAEPSRSSADRPADLFRTPDTEGPPGTVMNVTGAVGPRSAALDGLSAGCWVKSRGPGSLGLCVNEPFWSRRHSASTLGELVLLAGVGQKKNRHADHAGNEVAAGV
jgi:hypothetical protein